MDRKVQEISKIIDECESRINYEEHRDTYLEKLVHSYPILDLDDEKELFHLYKTTKDRTYKDIIFKCHLRDVHDTCQETSDYRSDLISEGIVLLCEFIDEFDYPTAYTTFTEALKTKLIVLYHEKSIENNKALDTEMSTQELVGLEKNNKCLTDTDEVRPVEEEPKEELVIVLNEGITIVPRKDYLLDGKTGYKILRETLGLDSKNKILTKRLGKKYKPGDMEY